MQKRVIIAFVLTVCLLFTSIPVFAAELNIDCEGAVLMEASTGKILYAKNENKRWEPASITKLMTLTLIMEAVKSGKVKMEDKILTSKYAASMGGSQVWLEEGEERTLREMLIAIAVGSANDASAAVAEHISGSVEAFVEQMNKKAKELGMENTQFANPHGLPDPKHYVAAKDMALLARYSLRYPEILALTSIKEYTFREEPKLLILYNTNKLLWWYPGADGLKTGWTPSAKRNLIATAKRDNVRLISVVLGVEKVKGHFIESMKMLNYGFANFGFKKLYDANSPIANVDVLKGTKQKVTLIAARDVGALHEKGKEVKPTTTIKISGTPTAPIVKGQKLGEIIVLVDNKQVESVELLAAEDVSKAGFLFNLKYIPSKVLSLGAIK